MGGQPLVTDFGRRSGVGDMLKATYDPNADGVIALAQTEADMKRSTYDPNLDGVIAIAQTVADMEKADYDSVINALVALAADHKTQHQNGGTDEIDATGLTGTGGLGLMVDGVAGRVLRLIYFYLSDGTNINTIKCQAHNVWNGDLMAEVDNIGKGDTVGPFTLEADGQKLVINASGFSGNIKFALINLVRGDPQTFPSIYPEKSGNNLRLHFYEAGTANSIDISGEIGTGQIRMLIAYITDA